MEQFKKRKLPEIIAGAGGKKSSGSARTPVEADDTVNSNVTVSILDLLGEGVIGGLKYGAKSIFLNDLPLQNSDDTYNHSGVTWWFRDGSQDQSIIEGFDYTETPKTIGLQVKKTSAVTMAVDSDSADRFRVILKFPSLKSVDKKTGDTSGTSVTYKFQVSSAGGAFVDVAPEGESSGTVTLTAKKAGVYYRSYMLNLPKPGSKYQVRVVRVTDDNKDTTYLANDIYVDTVGEIINTNMNYPNSALVGLSINSAQFGSSMPSRSYLISGMKIRVPSNYDEVTNEYRGTWDGSFKLLSSSNPAWILYDLVTNKRYGLGEFVRESMFDLGQLYQIGRYCDALVDDGFGGKEKRFAINTQITTLQDAYRCVQDIAGAFRGMVYWAGGMVHVTQDSPSDPIAIFSNSNVIDGRFSYKGSARKDRPSVALITYNNKEDNYKQNIEYVEDLEAIKRYGIRKTESVAFGCTSRGMAHRVGLWTLYTGRMESDVITFQTGMDSAFLVPGDVILIHDKFRAGRRNSGRVVASTANSITLDATVDMTKAGTITFINAEGRMISRDILESGVVSKVTFKDAVNEADRPVADGIWVISQSDLKPLQARVVGVAQGEDGVGNTITCIQNNPSKYAAIDDGAALIPQNTTVLDPTFSKPENLKITEGTYLSSPGNLNVSLTATWEGKSAEYWVSWRRSDAGNVSNWQTAKVNEEQFEVKPVAESGKYDFQVYGVSVSGRKTEILSTTYQVLGTMTPPGAPSSLTAVGDYRQIILGWSNPSSVDLDHIQIYASKTNDVTKATLLAKSTTTNFTHSGLEDSVTWYYWIRSANKRGMTSDWSSKLGTSAMTRDVLSFLQNKITNSELAKDLLADIDSKAVAAEVDASIEDAKSEATAQVEAAKKEASGALDAAKTTLSDAIKQEATDRAKAVADEAKMRAQAVASEVDARTKAISDEAIARADAITKESDTRTKAMADEVTARNKAVADEAAARATAISDSVAVEATARAKAIADSASSLSDKIEKEVTDRVKAVSDLDTKTANAISSESSSRIAAISDEAKTRADAILQEKNSRQAEIKNVSAQMQTANESLAQQISQVAAGTGEQFDSLKIWYFDAQTTEGWSGNKNAILSADGWIRSGNGEDTWLTSPAGLAIAGASYRFMKMRIRKVGNPVWEGAIRWITKSGDSFNNTNFITVSEPEYNAQGVATLTASDIKWNNDTVHQIRLDLSISTDDSNYIEVDWIAVGRPTPGAGMAALQDEKTARTNADAAEAASRSTLATQLRGSYDGTDITKLSSGLIFQEQQARVTADKVEATARQSLETKVNDSVSSINKSLDTLNTKDQAMASDITGLKSSLGDKADASAVQTLKATVEQQGSNISTQGQSITKLQGDLNTTNTNVGKKADQTAMTALQGTVTQQGKDIAAANSSISTLKSSLDTTNDAVAKKADATAVSDLSSRVSATEGSVSSQGDSITSQGDSITTLNNGLATANKAIGTKADASALSSLQNTVTQQGEDVAANTNNITALSNQVVNGKQATWARRIYKCQLASAGTEPTFSDIQGLSPVFMDEVADAAKMDFSGAGSYVVAHYKAMVRVAADTTITMAPGSRVFDDTGAVYVNGVRVAFGNAGWNTVSFDLKAGWNTVEFLVNQWTGNAYVNLGFKLGDKVAELYSGLGVSSLSSALNSINSNVSKVGDQVSSNSTAITSLKNGLSDTNSTVAKKADATALQTLQNTVTQQGKDIASQSDSVTNLSNALNNVSIGGVNLINNSGDMTGWSGKTNEIFRGNAVISATSKAGSSYRDLKEIILDAPVDNAEYVYSFFAKGGENGQSMTAYFYNPNSTISSVSSQGVSGGDVDGRMSFTLTTEWVRYWVKWKQKPGTGSKRLILARIQASSTKDQTVSITSPKLEVGNMPTEWSPAPSDMASSNDLSSLKTTVDANSGAIQSVTSRVQNTEDSISTQNTAITKLQGDLSTTNNLVSTKADSAALQTLSGRVDKTESSISTQNDAITKLNSSLDTTNKAVAKKAEQSSLDTLSGRVSSTENGITAANSSITSLNAAIRAENASSGDLITNPTFDPQYAQMGFTVVTTDTDGVPANCPFRYAAKLASRDHHPNFNTIVATLGDVFEISVLVACGAGNADFNLYLGTANGPTGGIGAPLYNGGNTKATSTWTRVTWKFTVSQAMVDKGYIRPFLQINQSSPFGTIWYVTDWHMRNITAASKAQDTANATSKAVDSLTSTVNQQGSDISSIGSRTTSLENGLSTTNANVSKKADSSALQTLQNSVTQQGNDISGQGSRVTSLENNLTAGANLIPNPAMLNGAQGWDGSATTVDGYAAVVSSSGWAPSSSYFQVTPGDIIDLSLMSQSAGAASISWGLRFDGPGLSNFCLYAPALTFAAGEKKSVSAAITVPAGATKAMFQASARATSARTVYNIIATRRDAGTKANSSAIDTLNSTVKTQGDTLSSIGSRTTSLENGLNSANSALSLKADASALSSLTNTVTQQGKDLDAAEANITAANTSITSMQASLTRRTVFTVTAKGNGNSANHGLFDESGKNLFTPGRSYALITFKANSDGSTVINTSKTYDVFGSANNGKAMSDDIAALANGVYVCVMTYDEPSGQRNSIASALELLGGTTEVINSLPYRGAYILLGRKGMKAGDGLELRAPTGGDSSAFISTSVEFVNGVMMGLGAAGGVMMKADANASAITTLQNTVKQQGDTIASSSSAITSLQNDMRTVNDNVSKKADASALQTLQNTVTQQGKDISTQSASLTQLNNSLSATNASIDASGKIPGNLIVNSSFERDKDGYTGWSSIASVIAASVPHSGSKILKLAAGGSVLVGQDVTYLKGRTYKIGAWAKQDSGTVIQAADNTKFRIADSTGLLASSVYGPFTSNWQEISFTWRPGKDVTAATQITAYLSAGAMYFDDFYVIDITDRVDLDATVSAVSGLTTRVSNAEGNISSQSDSITTLNNGLSTLNKTVSTKADATALSSLQNTVTQQGKDISSASGSITSLQSSLNTLKVQSNPWIDGTFETYDNNQQLGGSTAIVTTDFKNSGSKCLKVTRPANTSGNSDKMIGPYSAVRQSAKYRVEFWAMMPASEAPPSGWTVVVGLHSINKDCGNDWQGIAFDEAGLGGRDQWVKFTGVVKVSPSVTRSHVWISTRGQSGSNTPGYAVYIDDFVITDITDAADAQATADANATAISSLQTKVSDIDGKVTAQTSQLSSMQSKVDASSSKVDQLSKTISDSQSTQASLNTSLQSQIDAQASANIKNQADLNSAATSIATIKSTQSTQATQLSAIAKQQTDMTASLDNQSASIQTLQESVANNDSLKSTWMVKMETNSAGQKYAAGIALGVDGKSQQSQFLVQADRFALINTSNGNTTTPFVIDNGVTYMNAAYIKDGAITNAKIGGEIRSDNFVDGSQGWRVGKDGSSQFHNVVVRGHVEANSGSFRGAVYATDGWFQGTVYANRIEGDIGSFAINIAQHRTRKVPKATWQWFELARFRRQSFDQVINIRGGLLQTDSITIDGGAKLRAGMSYSSGADGGLNPGFLSHAMLLRATGATSGGGSMEIGIELMYETGGWDRLLTAQGEMNVDNMSFVVPAGSGDAVLRYGCYLDRNGQMVLTILSRFDAFSARNNNVIRGSSTP
ncbi:phage tail tip fiber protein [Klebsiella pneumoniae]|uniref:phage tail tip fiber protein n=1 Tax=Klebsiella pneumoniae TaxID=573 RepID=UPI00355AE488